MELVYKNWNEISEGSILDIKNGNLKVGIDFYINNNKKKIKLKVCSMEFFAITHNIKKNNITVLHTFIIIFLWSYKTNNIVKCYI